MNLHEYQSKQLFREVNIPVPDGLLVTDPDQAAAAFGQFQDTGCVIKAQVHAGGRGKAGGVRTAVTEQEATEAISELLGQKLVTPQTGAEGLPINALYVEPLAAIDHEYYLGMLIDRARKRISIIASDAGGMAIEEVAAATPEKIYTEFVNPAVGLQAYQARNLFFKMGLPVAQLRTFSALLIGLYQLFTKKDATLLEINPLVTTTDGRLLALDAKFNIDDNAMFRQKTLQDWRDRSQEDPREVEASEHQLNYIHLDGDIGCMVNGAGLAMATMDLIKLEGGEPANFLDVGGGTTAERVTAAFKLILSDHHVKAVLVNIFGGIVRCDLIAKGIIQAIEDVNIEVPVVIRLEGTQAAEGRKLLDDSGLAILSAESLASAARLVVAAAKGGQQ
ncbi:MAG TPA: ADP-forming succinate--CoA ligase subunit beta [Gammaproteobacteria bacterium]|nr:ADP-forming succinate--CoA ligase subunit beta [Gammaproteobacteria bacterium]